MTTPRAVKRHHVFDVKLLGIFPTIQEPQPTPATTMPQWVSCPPTFAKESRRTGCSCCGARRVDGGDRLPSSTRWLVGLLLLLSTSLLQCVRGCTSFGVGPGASADGSVLTAFNVDCFTCDWRVNKVPPQIHEDGATRRLVKFRSDYPRHITRSRGTTWLPENIGSQLEQREEWLTEDWMEGQYLPGTTIPEVRATYGSLEAQYGIINDMQVGMAESTCGTRFWAGPVGEDCSRCTARFDVSELSRIAMERASSAREAIQIMGSLAVEGGFYGSAWDEEDPMIWLEAGESLIISDPRELWVFHISPDDTAQSAVWVAQRVPDGHVTAVANQFVIREIPDSLDENWFMASPNVKDVAQRAGLWSPSEGSLDFAAVYAFRPGDIPHYTYSTRRVWRIFDVVAPSLGLSPYQDPLGSGLPFSVAPDAPVDLKVAMALLRDHYEGSEFDMTKGALSGPFGDFDRYDIKPGGQGDITADESQSGFFERAIGLFRTSHSYITQSRSTDDAAPNSTSGGGGGSGVAWIAPYSPSISTFVPLHVGIEEVPEPFSTGSLFAYDPRVSWWAACSVGNYAGRSRAYMQPVIAEVQSRLEDSFLRAEEEVTEGSDLTLLADEAVSASLLAYHDLLRRLFTTFHDGYWLEDPGSPSLKLNKQNYSRDFILNSGYLERREVDAAAVQITAFDGGRYDEVTRAKVQVLMESARLAGEAKRGIERFRVAQERLREALSVNDDGIGGAEDGVGDILGGHSDALSLLEEARVKILQSFLEGNQQQQRQPGESDLVGDGASTATAPSSKGSAGIYGAIFSSVGVVCAGMMVAFIYMRWIRDRRSLYQSLPQSS